MKHTYLILALCSLFLLSCNKGPEWVIVFESGQPLPTAEMNDTSVSLHPLTLVNDALVEMKVDDGSYIRFSDPKGNLSDFGPGKYSYKRIGKLFYKQSAHHKPLPEKYVDYIWNQMNAEKTKSGLSTKATVLRFDPKSIKGEDYVISPKALEFIDGDEINFSWSPFGDGNYLLVIKQDDGDWSKVSQTKETSMRLPTVDLPKNSFYTFRIEGGGSDKKFFLAGE
jgi:hypothetical protein